MARQQTRLIDGEVILAVIIGPGSGNVGDADKRFALSALRGPLAEVGKWAVTTVRQSLPDQPDRLQVESGIKLAVKSGKLFSVFAESSGESTLVVRMDWEKKAGGDGPPVG
jgi:hypothetical protein